MNTGQARDFIDDLAEFGVPVLLFSGGEPLMRDDLVSLITHARTRGIRCVISTNGTLITSGIAERLAEAGLSYVGVSIDGLAETHDAFRRVEGAYSQALRGIRICRDAGIKVGLRYTITRDNVQDIPGIFSLMEQENIPRICFYHLVYSGRATGLQKSDCDATATRDVVEYIIDTTAEMYHRGQSPEVLTVDNHADGVYLYLRMRREGNPRARDVLALLRMNGGNSSGRGIGCVSWDGTVYPDQFWRAHSLGNVLHTPFSAIWNDMHNPLLASLRRRAGLLKGRCGRCVWQDVCNGNFRARAEAVYDDMWAQDPACYLTEEEISDTTLVEDTHTWDFQPHV
jgi:radical SAM protein with 4Fe4S-binding SPASM domain